MKNIKNLTKEDFDKAVQQAMAKIGFKYPLKKFQIDVLFDCVTERLATD